MKDIERIKNLFQNMNETKGLRIRQIAKKTGTNYTRTCANLNKLYRCEFVGKVKTFGGFVLYYNKMKRIRNIRDEILNHVEKGKDYPD